MCFFTALPESVDGRRWESIMNCHAWSIHALISAAELLWNQRGLVGSLSQLVSTTDISPTPTVQDLTCKFCGALVRCGLSL
jgi:hypothetical protein